LIFDEQQISCCSIDRMLFHLMELDLDGGGLDWGRREIPALAGLPESHAQAEAQRIRGRRQPATAARTTRGRSRLFAWEHSPTP